MGGRRIALLGAMLVISGALAGCMAESTDSTTDDGDDVAASQAPIQLARPGSRSAAPPQVPIAASRLATPIHVELSGAPDPGDEVDPSQPGSPEEMFGGNSSDDGGCVGPGCSPEPQPWRGDEERVAPVRNNR